MTPRITRGVFLCLEVTIMDPESAGVFIRRVYYMRIIIHSARDSGDLEDHGPAYRQLILFAKLFWFIVCIIENKLYLYIVIKIYISHEIMSSSFGRPLRESKDPNL